jgi:hypothetical protein
MPSIVNTASGGWSRAAVSLIVITALTVLSGCLVTHNHSPHAKWPRTSTVGVVTSAR